MILTVVSYVLATACVLSGIVVLRGTNAWSRLLGYTLVASKVNMLVVVLAQVTGRTFYLDIALVYTLLSYVGVLVLSQYMAGKEPADA
ncbi:multiple resistance and pH regulation protein F [Xylanimonas cellulosilytica DSM 15894]|uniref:Multiple resistance and pH regulation protein F n=1 Tax=Xylanimonas cellulosilytica (strain DSM 15894 / JCM 12276 / CECT 5975 / KCTC 9989 / LMG 20990 / NBRC 107835 / XIL07) TaxID=446471 RepID=D1BT22_XYLCX|nr:monovalent cation/H+ antiporter complex subunit F [Xylanimonas cellulosilytica]ACZ30864.1 multiple resistance and pH regulation protein F [Xylanimonas cellulosilytica DSM 15894]